MENSQQQQQLDLLTPVRRKLLNQLVHAEVKNLLKLLVIDCVVRIAGRTPKGVFMIQVT